MTQRKLETWVFKPQKQICRTVGPSLSSYLEPLAHCQNVASLYILCGCLVMFIWTSWTGFTSLGNLKSLQNSLEKTCAGVCFLIQRCFPANFSKFLRIPFYRTFLDNFFWHKKKEELVLLVSKLYNSIMKRVVKNFWVFSFLRTKNNSIETNRNSE